MSKNILMNIPTFPKFKKLGLEDKESIYTLTSKFLPYSDYNFVSLWSYNTGNDIIVSQLHQNLILRFKDYILDEQFYSFLGDNKIKETIEALLKHAKKENIVPKLKLIPEENILKYPKLFNFFKITEDRDNFDYIFLTEEISKLEGSKFSNKRNKVNNFIKVNSPISVALLDIKDPKIHKVIIDLCLAWKKNKKQDGNHASNELYAIKRLLNSSEFLNVLSLGIYNANNKLIGFSIIETVHQKNSLIHFVKADSSYIGLFEYIYKSTASELYKRGRKYVNRQQDLGIPGLRQAKSSWRPIAFLKKYIISPKD